MHIRQITYLCVALALLITMVPLGPPNMHCRESYVHANHHMFETTLSPSFGRGLGLHSGLSALLELPGRQTPCDHVSRIADLGSRILDLVGQCMDLLPLGMVALPLGMVDTIYKIQN